LGTSTTGTTTTPGTTTGGASSLFEPVQSQVGEVRPPLAAPSPTPVAVLNAEQSDISYSISVLGTQLIFNGTSYPEIRGTFFQPRRGESPPLEVAGEMPYIPRSINLANAIELGKERRPFLKQARANVLNQKEQVRAAAGQYLPTITTTGGGEWVSSPINSSWHDISKGWTALVQGSLPIWDSGAIAGQVIQQRALLSEAKITYDDDVRQVELEIQTAYSN